MRARYLSNFELVSLVLGDFSYKARASLFELGSRSFFKHSIKVKLFHILGLCDVRFLCYVVHTPDVQSWLCGMGLLES